METNQLPEIFRPTTEILASLRQPTAVLLQAGWLAQRNELVERAQAVERVAGESSQRAAADLLNEVQGALSQLESARKAIKDPFLQLGKRIDAAAKEGAAPLEQSKASLKRMIEAFQAEVLRKQQEEQRRLEAELSRQREERQAAEREAARLELERQMALRAGDEAAAQAAREAAEAERARMLESDLKAMEAVTAPLAMAPKAENIAVRQYWKVTVVDAHKLYAVFPELVELSPRQRELQSAVNRMAEANPNEPPQMPGCEVKLETEVRSR